MPQSKNPLLRYKILDQLFRNFGRSYDIEELHEALNQKLLDQDKLPISRRQLRKDIAYMKSEEGYGAPIEVVEGNPPTYRYQDPNFSIRENSLSVKEAGLLSDALKMLERFEGSPQFAWLQELNPVIQNAFGLSSQKNTVISWQSNIDYAGYPFITRLFEAINNRQVLKITYQPFDNAGYEFNFHPYFLKQYNQRWFAFGLNESTGKDTWNVPLDRIQKAEEVQGIYQVSNRDWEEYFDQIIGVTVPADQEMQLISIKAAQFSASYITTKPFHHSQKNYHQEDGSLIFTINLIPNYELEALILSYGEGVEVISPISLRERIASRSKALAKAYP